MTCTCTDELSTTVHRLVGLEPAHTPDCDANDGTLTTTPLNSDTLAAQANPNATQIGAFE